MSSSRPRTQVVPLASQRLSRQAPRRLEVVRDFVNTRDAEAGTDDFSTPAGVREWLVRQRLIGPSQEMGFDDAERIVLLRTALRRLILANSAPNPLAPDEAAALDTRLAGLPLRLTVASGRLALAPAAGGHVPMAAGHLLAAVANALADGTWQRLKCCHSESCRWVFYDASPALSARWCSMRVCGAREKARRYRRRATPAPVSAPRSA